MKNLIFTIIALTFILSGCSNKAPEVDLANGGISYNVNQEDAGRTYVAPSNTGQALETTAKKDMQNIYFDFDKFNIRPNMQAAITGDAYLFNTPELKNRKIQIQGYCDEWGTDQYNYALGLKRAKTVKDALVRKGVSASRLTMISYGESRPVCKNKGNAECDALNRRVEFKIL